MYLLGNLPFFKTHVNCFMTGDDSLCAVLSQVHVVGEGPGAALCFEVSLYPISKLLTGTKRLASKGALFLSPSDVYIRSFLYFILQ